MEEKIQRAAFGKCLLLPQDINMKQSQLAQIVSEVLCKSVGVDCFLSTKETPVKRSLLDEFPTADSVSLALVIRPLSYQVRRNTSSQKKTALPFFFIVSSAC